MRTYSIAKRPVPSGFWINAPKLTRTLQRSLHVNDSDLKCFVVGVVLQDDDVERFITPKTPQDGVFWANGLDQVALLSDSFLLFDTVEDAMNTSYRWGWERATIYKFVADSERPILYLEPEMQA